MFTPSGIVTLLTDFGASDSYVGQMKGAMLAVEPSLAIVDLTHEVPPQDVIEGAFQLATAMAAFPPGTVHVGVVDPGVGTERRAIALLGSGSAFVGPDNGLASLAFPPPVERMVQLTNATYHRATVTPTFHGRDIFAPVAGALASGVDLGALGSELDPNSLLRLEIPTAQYEPEFAEGCVISIDRFGNCLTMLDSARLRAYEAPLNVACRDFRASALDRTYADQPPGEALALIGSHGYLELAVRGGSASKRFGIRRGDVVRVTGKRRTPGAPAR